MGDEEFVCPFPWKWSEIYSKIHEEWQARGDEEIPEPPHMLPAITNDAHRKERWEETVAWAEQYGFEIAPIAEHEKYYRM